MFDALILTGGKARRMSGRDKAAAQVGGQTLRQRVVAAVAGAQRVIEVGAEQDGGPVAAIAAGLQHVTAPDVVVLAGDLPFLTGAAVGQLLAALTEGAAVAVDDDGRDQPLCAAWRTASLRAALTALGDPFGASMRRLMATCSDVVRITLRGEPPPWFDCDTPEDLAQAQRWAAQP